MFEKDLGSALVFFFVFSGRTAWGKKFYLVIGVLHRRHQRVHRRFGHVQVRVNTWLDPFADAQNTGQLA